VIRAGIDLVRVERLAELDPAIRARFIRRVFTPAEQAQADGRDESLAGLFAAKEAVSKALGCGIGQISWQEIEILRESSGEPRLILHGAAKTLADQKGLLQWSVSITHEGGMAAAVALAAGAEA
jgi:holo-[acyl-carrier protein] synthase